MKKNYWWRIILFAVSAGVLLISYIGPCGFKISRCLGGNSILVTRTMFHIFIAILISSIFLFLVNDKVFLKWVRFAAVWIILSIILIALTPEYSGGWIPQNPTRESVSILMSLLFVILSLAKIIWDSRRQKNI